MKTYYYIAYRKPRGRAPLRYVCDGVMQANTVKEVKEIIADAKGVAKSRVKVKLHDFGH
jgi:hypothetical protein